MKTQDDNALPSSSSRRENSPKTLHAKSIGCMSGIFRLLYNYNNSSRRRGKFLTFGKKQEKNVNMLSSSASDQLEKIPVNGKVTRFSCNVPRSPTLPAEIRRSITLKSPPEKFPTTDAEVATESAAEKRRKLLEALEKCDEDLKALKNIIDVVKSSVVVEDNINGDKQLQLNGDPQPQPQPSPVSVLDDLTPSSSTLSSYSRRYTNGRAIVQQQQQPQQQKQKQKKRPGEEEDIASICLATSSSDHEAKMMMMMMRENAIGSPLWASKAMIDSVDQVCKDMAWGERREIGRIGLALQDFICRDLIEEIVRELATFSLCMYSLPFQACQRSLRF